MSSKNCKTLMDWAKCVEVGDDACSMQQRRGCCACAAPTGVRALASSVLPAASAGAESALAQPRRTHSRFYSGLFLGAVSTKAKMSGR